MVEKIHHFDSFQPFSVHTLTFFFADGPKTMKERYRVKLASVDPVFSKGSLNDQASMCCFRPWFYIHPLEAVLIWSLFDFLFSYLSACFGYVAKAFSALTS